MMGTMAMRQPENWLYEIWQKGQDSPCYVMVPNAKDLVKSHLMIAVREEVEVLKEKISELMDKINQLEVENTLLKANISQETLQQLQMQTQLQIAGSGQTAGNNMITAPPQPPSSTAAAVVTAPGTATTVTAQNVAANNTANANNQVVPNTISNSNGSAATAEGSGSATPTAAAAPSAENPNIANSSQANNANNAGDANNASNGTATGSVVTAGSTNGPMS
uniref:Uncharacterized protein n=1 Tax=Glossina brevipalpis TaxID=37001 RepID=A0A1A9WZP9_9MUSC